MTTKSRTIDNLGADASIRYARDKELFEPKFIEESRFVSGKTEIPSLKPYAPSEFDQMFSSRKTSSWASFSAPPESLTNPNTLFSYQLIPSLGEGIQDDGPLFLEDALQKMKGSKKKKSKKEEEEKEILSLLLACIQKIDKSLALINSRRNQYQRG